MRQLAAATYLLLRPLYMPVPLSPFVWSHAGAALIAFLVVRHRHERRPLRSPRAAARHKARPSVGREIGYSQSTYTSSSKGASGAVRQEGAGGGMADSGSSTAVANQRYTDTTVRDTSTPPTGANRSDSASQSASPGYAAIAAAIAGGSTEQSSSKRSPQNAPDRKRLSSGCAGSSSRSGASPQQPVDVAAARTHVAHAVLDMQEHLQSELHEKQLHIYSVIGRGGFGTVYHGAPPPRFCQAVLQFSCAVCSCMLVRNHI